MSELYDKKKVLIKGISRFFDEGYYSWKYSDLEKLSIEYKDIAGWISKMVSGGYFELSNDQLICFKVLKKIDNFKEL